MKQDLIPQHWLTNTLLDDGFIVQKTKELAAKPLPSFAEFERAMLRERTRSGLIAASKEGRLGGRRPKLSPRQQHEVMALINSGKSTAADAARLFNVHPSTVGRLVARRRVAD